MSQEGKQQQTSDQEEGSLTRSGQRRVNIIWEATQSTIALLVTSITLYAALKLTLMSPTQTAAFSLMSNSFFLVVGFYFGRTNHQRTGGVDSQHKGR